MTVKLSTKGKKSPFTYKHNIRVLKSLWLFKYIDLKNHILLFK